MRQEQPIQGKEEPGETIMPGNRQEKTGGGKPPAIGRIMVVFLLWGLGYAFSAYSTTGSEVKFIPLYIGKEKFLVEIADTPEKQIRGMMFRENVPADFGMLFIHESEDYRSFWMKNCRVSLDIIYLDRNKQIINMHIDVPPCKGEPCETYPSEQPAQYVLELRGNRAKELNLKPGDTIFFIL